MRRLYAQLTKAMSQFLNQRNNLLLLIPCADSDIALVMKALRDLDRRSDSDLFLLFADDFETPAQYVGSLAKTLQDEWVVTEGAIAGGNPLAPLPPAFLAPLTPPPARLEAGLGYARSLIDTCKGQRFVWGMGPASIKDPKTYLQLLATLPPKDEILPWMRGARIVARVPADFKLEQSPLANSKRVAVESFNIPPDIFAIELKADAADVALPLADRMQAEVQLAYLDYAYSRFDEATTRFRKALAFFQWAEVPAMEGLILSGMGDISRRQGNLDKAHHWYACAVEPAVKAENAMLLATVVQNLAVIAFQQKRFADAEERYSELVTLKRTMIDEIGLADSLEWQGVSQERQNAYDRAIVCWEEAALICKAFEMKERLTPVLANLKRGYQQLDMREELADFDSEWNA